MRSRTPRSLRLRVVRYPHYATMPSGARLQPPELRAFCADYDLPETDYATVACVDRKLIGVFRFSLMQHGPGIIGTAVIPKTLVACGTWVDPKFRRRQVGSMLWLEALKRFDPVAAVEVLVASKPGLRLVQRIAAARKATIFDIDTDTRV